MATAWRERGNPPAQPLGALTKGSMALLKFFRSQPTGGVGVFLLTSLIVVAVLAPLIAPYDPLEFAPATGNVLKEKLQGPSADHWLGTDHFGRDLLSRIIYGARVSLYVSVIAVTASSIVAACLGIVSGYIGGVLDLVLQRIIDVLMGFPLLILALVMVAILGPGINNTIIAIVVAMIPGSSRIIRSATLSIRETQYVIAARSIGASQLRIMALYILPNVMAPLIVIVAVHLGLAVLVEASLSFLGLGVRPPTPSWGMMLSIEGRPYMEQNPWMMVWPGLAIGIAVFSINMIGDALRDTLDPKLRGRM